MPPSPPLSSACSPVWWRPEWPAPPGVHALMTTRGGGESRPPFDALNVGDHVGDEPAAVQANRRRLAEAVGARPVFLKQVHGADCAVLTPTSVDGEQADACATTHRQLACTVMVADCLPVLFCDGQGRAVGAAHAGWRGLAGVGSDQPGVLPKFLECFSALALSIYADNASKNKESNSPLNVLAWLGPCIGHRAFVVGPEVREAFLASPLLGEAAVSCFDPVADKRGFFHCDLAALARLQLQALGVFALYGNDSSEVWCTASQPSVWFSHRRDTAALGGTGRMAACIWLG